MAQGNSPGTNNKNHRWTFFRAGGFDQVKLSTGADLVNLDQLDQKLWSSLSCPVKGVEFDARTLEIIDGDGDSRIRAPEIIEAVKWAGAMLKEPDDLLKSSPVLPLAAINDKTPEGMQLLDSARHILATLGKQDSPEVTIDDVADVAAIISLTRFNGDGIITTDAADSETVRQLISDIMECVGPETDRSGKPGISQEKADLFFAEALAYSDWKREGDDSRQAICPLGEATESAAAALSAVREKIDDYFSRCRLAAFDARALGALNRSEEEYVAIAGTNLTPSVEALAGFPLAMVDVKKVLPLGEGLNPAWAAAMARFDAEIVKPLVGPNAELTEADWDTIKAKFSAYFDWNSRKAGQAVEKLGIEKIREILDSNARDTISGLIGQDKAKEPEFKNITQVERLVRYHRDLFTLLKNYVSFGDFYTRKDKAIFQAGTLYLDGRSCELCVRVNDIDQHAGLAALSRIYLAYCKCTRRGGAETMTIAAAFTGGDSDFLMVGRNGIFYDRKGRDWDATIAKIIDNPISIRQAFFAPYKKALRMIEEQVQKFAEAREKESEARLHAAAAAGVAPQPAKGPVDVGKMVGIVAALGVGVGAVGTLFGGFVAGFMALQPWYAKPVALLGAGLAISGPSMLLAWLKLRQRTLGPVLEGNGWAVNGRVRVNIPLGTALTDLKSLPPGSTRSLDDPFEDKQGRRRRRLLWLAAALLGAAAVAARVLHAWPFHAR